MAIVDKLKANIKAAGGDVSGIRNIEDAVAKMSVGAGGGSGGGKPTMINIVPDGDGGVKLDKTFAEVETLCNNGVVVCYEENLEYEGSYALRPIVEISYEADNLAGHVVVSYNSQLVNFYANGKDDYPMHSFD